MADQGGMITKGSATVIAKTVARENARRLGGGGAPSEGQSSDVQGPFLGKVQKDAQAGTFATVNYWAGDIGSEADTGISEQVFIRITSVSAGDWCYFDNISGKGYEALPSGSAPLGSPGGPAMSPCHCADCLPITTAANWVAQTAYLAGTFVQPSPSNGHTYICTVGGTSGTSQPSFPVGEAATVSDGSVTWTEQTQLTTGCSPINPMAQHWKIVGGENWVAPCPPTDLISYQQNCTWKSKLLAMPTGDPKQWVLDASSDPVTLTFQADSTHSVQYQTPLNQWWPTCGNMMTLINPKNLPAKCLTPCQICLKPVEVTPISVCSGCSWPTKFSVTISGISSTSDCQMNPPVISAGLTNPTNWPDSPCYHQGPAPNFFNNPLMPGCDTINGTFTLTGPAATGFDSLAGSQNTWSFLGTTPICINGGGGLQGSNAGNMPALQMSCVSGPINNALGGTAKFNVPGGGMVFLLSTVQGQAAYIGTPGNAHWQCSNIRYTIPYFCPFSEISCLQSITFNQLPYTVQLAGGFFLFPLSCQDFPSTITVSPLP